MRFLGSLCRNRIGYEGAKAIGEALATNQSLTSLEYAAPLHALAFYSPLLSAAADAPLCFLAHVLSFVCAFLAAWNTTKSMMRPLRSGCRKRRVTASSCCSEALGIRRGKQRWRALIRAPTPCLATSTRAHLGDAHWSAFVRHGPRQQARRYKGATSRALRGVVREAHPRMRRAGVRWTGVGESRDCLAVHHRKLARTDEA